MTPHLVFTSIVETEAVIDAIIQCKQALFVLLIQRMPQSCFLNPAGWLDAMHHFMCQCQSLDRNLPVKAHPGAVAQGLSVMTPLGKLIGNVCNDLNFHNDQWLWTGVPNEGKKAK